MVKPRFHSLHVGNGLDSEPLYTGLDLPRKAARHLWMERFPAIPFTLPAIYDWMATKGIDQSEAANLTWPEVCTMLRSGEPALADDTRPTEASGHNGKKPPRKRRPSKECKPQPLTSRQTEVMQIVGECKGNIAAAAKRLGRDYSTIAEIYHVGLTKLGKIPVKHGTKTLPHDRRGQVNLSDSADTR